MRKIFGGSMLVSLLGVVILGGSLAWERTQHSDIHVATVGSLDWGMLYVPFCEEYVGEGQIPEGDCGPIGPSGETVTVGGGGIWNDEESNFNIQLRASDYGEVSIIDVSGDNTTCDVGNFSGDAVDASAETGDILQPGAHGGPFLVELTVDEGAPEACEGRDVFYSVLITVETVGGEPGDVS